MPASALWGMGHPCLRGEAEGGGTPSSCGRTEVMVSPSLPPIPSPCPPGCPQCPLRSPRNPPLAPLPPARLGAARDHKMPQKSQGHPDTQSPGRNSARFQLELIISPCFAYS